MRTRPVPYATVVALRVPWWVPPLLGPACAVFLLANENLHGAALLGGAVAGLAVRRAMA